MISIKYDIRASAKTEIVKHVCFGWGANMISIKYAICASAKTYIFKHVCFRWGANMLSIKYDIHSRFNENICLTYIYCNDTIFAPQREKHVFSENCAWMVSALILLVVMHMRYLQSNYYYRCRLTEACLAMRAVLPLGFRDAAEQAAGAAPSVPWRFFLWR